VTLTKLLKGLRANKHENLLCNAKTLLETPIMTSIINTHSGTYYHHGLQKALKDYLTHIKHSENTIKLNLSIDRLLLAKSLKT